MTTRTLSINNVLHHEKLDIELPNGPIMITGKNSSGKTSIAKTIAAVVTHNTNPWRLSAAKVSAYQKKGTIAGFASISDGATWTIPSEMRVPTGCVPEATGYTTGIIDFIPSSGSSPKSRAELFEGLFMPEDPASLLKDAWKLDERQYMYAIEEINKRGWADTAKFFGSKKTEAGRKWSSITGKNFGVGVAPKYTPEHWSSDMDGVSEEDLNTELQNVKDSLDQVNVKQAVDQERIDRGFHARDVLLPELATEIETARVAYNQAHEIAKEAEATYNVEKAKDQTFQADIAKLKGGIVQVKKGDIPQLTPCPKCKCNLFINAGKIVEYVPEDESVIEEIMKQNGEIGKQVLDMIAKRDEHAKHMSQFETEWSEKRTTAVTARDNMNQISGRMQGVKNTALDAGLQVTSSNDAMRSSLEIQRHHVENKKKAWHQFHDAMQMLDNYMTYKIIEEMLGPKGVRAQFMVKQMDRVRGCLDKITEITEWLPISITNDYTPTSDGLPVQMTAENEQRKVQWAMSIALAMLNADTCKWVILDAADLLKDESWDGLMKLIDRLSAKFKDKEEFHVVVCATSAIVPDHWHTIDINPLVK